MTEYWARKAERLAAREGVTFREACSRLQARAVRVRKARANRRAVEEAEEARARMMREARPDLY